MIKLKYIVGLLLTLQIFTKAGVFFLAQVQFSIGLCRCWLLFLIEPGFQFTNCLLDRLYFLQMLLQSKTKTKQTFINAALFASALETSEDRIDTVLFNFCTSCSLCFNNTYFIRAAYRFSILPNRDWRFSKQLPPHRAQHNLLLFFHSQRASFFVTASLHTERNKIQLPMGLFTDWHEAFTLNRISLILRNKHKRTTKTFKEAGFCLKKQNNRKIGQISGKSRNSCDTFINYCGLCTSHLYKALRVHWQKATKNECNLKELSSTSIVALKYSTYPSLDSILCVLGRQYTEKCKVYLLFASISLQNGR